jgi:hypothetical protein
MYNSWDSSGRPEESAFLWPTDEFFDVGCASELFWSNAEVYHAVHGPRRRRRHEDRLSPMGVAGLREQTLVVAFRGTSWGPDWYVNFQAIPHPLRLNHAQFGWVHDGFEDIYRSMEPALCREVEGLLQQAGAVERVLVTGHSLGAAVATLAMTYLASSRLFGAHRPRFELYTFGSPRVGDHHFQAAVQNLSHRIYRFKNHEDVVTAVPPEGYFTHVGELCQLNVDAGSPSKDHSLECYKTGVGLADFGQVTV